MQSNFRLLSVLTLTLLLVFSSCKKDDKPIESDPATEIAAHAEDQNRISTELDAVANDAVLALESDVAFSGRMQDINNTNVICGATTVVDTTSNPRTITISYNGLNCAGNHFRTGTVVLSMAAGVFWKNAGAAITVSFNNFKIKRVSDNKSITINGTQTLTNVTGGLLFQLSGQGQIVHTTGSSNMSITFDDGTQRSWQIARKRTFSYNNGIVLQIEGNHTIGSNTGVAEWGVNRFGHPFATAIMQPLVFRQDCAARLTSGEVKHTGFATAVVVFGLDSTGNPTSCPATGSYFYKVTWTGPGGNSMSAIFPY